MTSGQVAYEAYLKNTGGVSLVSGVRLPEWSALPVAIQSAWNESGTAVIEFAKKQHCDNIAKHNPETCWWCKNPQTETHDPLLGLHEAIGVSEPLTSSGVYLGLKRS
jgi:hypothetical protein